MNPFLHNTFGIIVFLSLQIGLCSGQSVYLKTGGRYQVPVNRQKQPEYFNFVYSIPYMEDIYINMNNSDFSIAKGFCFQETVGYNVNNFLSVELNISYFSNAERDFDSYPKPVYAFNGTTNWNYKNLGLTPAISLARAYKRSTVKISVFSGIGFSDLEVKASFNTYSEIHTFDRSLSYSYGCGFEYLFKLSKLFQVYADMGINNLIYTPKHSELTESTGRYIENLPVNMKEIDYVKEIKHLKSANTEPEKRIQEALKLNSLYFGMGIKFTITKNEKK